MRRASLFNARGVCWDAGPARRSVRYVMTETEEMAHGPGLEGDGEVLGIDVELGPREVLDASGIEQLRILVRARIAVREDAHVV